MSAPAAEDGYVAGDGYVARLEALSRASRERAAAILEDSKDRHMLVYRRELLAQVLAYDNALEVYRSWARECDEKVGP